MSFASTNWQQFLFTTAPAIFKQSGTKQRSQQTFPSRQLLQRTIGNRTIASTCWWFSIASKRARRPPACFTESLNSSQRSNLRSTNSGTFLQLCMMRKLVHGGNNQINPIQCVDHVFCFFFDAMDKTPERKATTDLNSPVVRVAFHGPNDGIQSTRVSRGFLQKSFKSASASHPDLCSITSSGNFLMAATTKSVPCNVLKTYSAFSLDFMDKPREQSTHSSELQDCPGSFSWPK